MSFGDFMGFLVGMGTIVSVVGILANAYKTRLIVKHRQWELRQFGRDNALPPAAETIPGMDRLESRLRVLERIATDRRSSLSDEIEALRRPALEDAR